ncbi:MAG: D-sedoheptulose 7-phosphate isomerase [Candidatus Aminicenantes bacterium]|nr:MAG: D-sedoheptulose 7-phosphate isomerase [Candidatus Aminicenantes bacterium]
MKYKDQITKQAQITQDFFDRKEIQYAQAVDEICASLKRGNKIIVFGNGGSAAQAQHFAAELINKYLKSRRAIPALSLTTDTSSLTSIANDFAFDYVFSRQLEALGKDGDVVLALSTSGESQNVIRALKTAREKGLFLIGLTGEGGGAVGPLCDILLDVPSLDTPRVQEVHLFLLHMLCQEIEEKVG